MSKPYDFEAIETNWQKRWADSKVFEVTEDTGKPEFYCLAMLPYPSGKIHMGHVRNYSIVDVVARFKAARGFNVLHPIGWDALGLPAENAALKHGAHPETWTRSNISHMKNQLQRLGFSYAWRREIATCDADYYRWNQWFFIQMWKRGLAFRKKSPVNWCPSCATVLANEQVEGGRCWRCESEVTEKELEQWFLKTTAYADELLEDMKQIGEWPERVLTMQRNWIGRSVGAEVEFPVVPKDTGETTRSIRVFTTRIDTIYGASFVVLAPEHPLTAELAAENEDLARFVSDARAKARAARLSAELEKTGVPTGRYAINPFTKKNVPIWVSDYVLMEYGTGAVMAVPAHDERDFAFAKKYDLPIPVVIQPKEADLRTDALGGAFVEYGTVVDSGPFTGLPSEEAIAAMTRSAEEQGIGNQAVTYRLRDWGISRQRYWGTPIPMLYCDSCGVLPVPEESLPVVLPPNVQITGTGESVLKSTPEYVEASCPRCGGDARRETDTMDTFVDSSWYFYRYTDPTNESLPVSPHAAKYWFPIDLYVGGIEHAILHLIYSRFWTKVMRDLGLVEIDEPVVRLLSQGMVLKDGSAMSKSRGNVVEPDEVVGRYGADTLRLYVLFEAPPEKEMDWTDQRLEGPARFLQRVWRVVDQEGETLRGVPPIEGNEEFTQAESALRRKTHETIMRVTRDIEERLHLNTAIAAIMELVNEIYRILDPRPDRMETWKVVREATEHVIRLLNPFAPHVTEEMWETMGHRKGLTETAWPSYDAAIAARETITMVLQVNGKVRSRISVPADVTEEEVKQRVLEEDRIRAETEGKSVDRVIVVPRRLVNVVVKG